MSLTWRPHWLRETRERQADTPRIEQRLNAHIATLQGLTLMLDAELARLKAEVESGGR